MPTVSLALSTRLSFGINALNSRCRIWSHTIITVEQVLAVELEPPATGAGGRSLSPMKTDTFSTGTSQLFRGRLPDHGVGAVADLMAGDLDADAAVALQSRTRAAAGAICVG